MSDAHDHDWLLARERGDSTDAVPLEVRTRYERLERMLAELPGTAPAPGWKERVLAEIERSDTRPIPFDRRRHRVRYAIAFSTVAAAALVLLAVFVRRDPPDETSPTLTTEVIAGSAIHRGGPIIVGDKLVVKARSNTAAELRVYENSRDLLARCVAGEPCETRDGARRSFRVEIVLRVVGQVRSVLFIGPNMPAPSGTMDEDLAAAARANITTLSPTPIIVE